MKKLPRAREKNSPPRERKRESPRSSGWLETKSSLHGGENGVPLQEKRPVDKVDKLPGSVRADKKPGRAPGKFSVSGKGDQVAIVGENSPEWAISYFAVVWAGATAVPLDSRATEQSLRRVLGLSDSRFLVASGGFLETLGRERGIEAAIPMEEVAENPGRAETREPAETVDPDRVAEIVFTSGTTGTPKGVMLSHGNVMSSVEAMYRAFPIGDKDTAFSILPIHHVYERICGIVLSFYCGQTVFFFKKPETRGDARGSQGGQAHRVG